MLNWRSALFRLRPICTDVSFARLRSDHHASQPRCPLGDPVALHLHKQVCPYSDIQIQIPYLDTGNGILARYIVIHCPCSFSRFLGHHLRVLLCCCFSQKMYVISVTFKEFLKNQQEWINLSRPLFDKLPD